MNLSNFMELEKFFRNTFLQGKNAKNTLSVSDDVVQIQINKQSVIIRMLQDEIYAK